MPAFIYTQLLPKREALPEVVPQSLMLGIPVIGVDIRRVYERFVDGCGFLSEPGEVKALVRAMQRVFVDPDESNETGQKRHERIKSYASQNTIHLHKVLHAEALGNQPALRPA